MAASIAGIGNSIAAFTSGYQAAKQAERNYGTEQKKLTIQEEEAKARKDYYDYLKGQKTQSAAADNTAVNWFSSLPENYSKFQEWKRLGMPSANSPSLQNTSQLVPANVLQNEQQPNVYGNMPSNYFWNQSPEQFQYNTGVPVNAQMPLFPPTMR